MQSDRRGSESFAITNFICSAGFQEFDVDQMPFSSSTIDGRKQWMCHKVFVAASKTL